MKHICAFLKSSLHLDNWSRRFVRVGVEIQ